MKRYTASVLAAGTAIQLESLPLAKITHYPLEKCDYKPFAQVTFCIGAEALGFRFTCFECKPDPESKLCAMLYLFPEEPDQLFEIWATPKGVEAAVWEAGVLKIVPVEVRPRSGEDLQGEYWGFDALVPRSFTAWRIAELADKQIPGNFFKILTTGREHYGAFFPADFATPITAPENMGTIELVSY